MPRPTQTKPLSNLNQNVYHSLPSRTFNNADQACMSTVNKRKLNQLNTLTMFPSNPSNNKLSENK